MLILGSFLSCYEIWAWTLTGHSLLESHSMSNHSQKPILISGGPRLLKGVDRFVALLSWALLDAVLGRITAPSRTDCSNHLQQALAFCLSCCQGVSKQAASPHIAFAALCRAAPAGSPWSWNVLLLWCYAKEWPKGVLWDSDATASRGGRWS